uniref:I/LWEQ domain-containing protein n=1 Tax=Glossina brevipalpis TaxID=37001 RepID=A0A1A9WDG6_9MUSC
MDKDSNNLVVSITKALNPSEAPLKMKHARNVIIATYRTKELKSFWSIITRQPLMVHRFTAWKFCHMLHKVMREGHPISLKQSLIHKALILDVGKLWGHLQDGVGACIESYTKLIVNKLEFHEKNVIFPGSLLIEFNEIENYANDDANIYFQLCVEIFDYLDHIIDVQNKIFDSVNMFRMSSMILQGQCRLSPLINLIQDSNPLYDISVRLIFKLHNRLPSDVLSGHRERFNDLFSKIKYFYNNVRPLQYFADVIQVPSLPENAPNFLSEIELGIYVPPKVDIKLEQEESMKNITDNLRFTENPNLSEKDEIIKRLQEELLVKEGQLKNEAKLIYQISELSFQNHSLQTELTAAKCKLIEAMITNENLENQLKDLSSTENEIKEWEEKTKFIEEKFEKMKLLYANLREEHINLLRTEGILLMDMKGFKLKIQEMEEKLNMETREHEQQLANKNLEINKLKSDIILMQKMFEELKEESVHQLINYQELLKRNDSFVPKYLSNDDEINFKRLEHAKVLRENENYEDSLTTDSNVPVEPRSSGEELKLNENLRNLNENIPPPNNKLLETKNETQQLRPENLLVDTVSTAMKETFKILDCLRTNSESTAEEALQNIGSIEQMLQQLNIDYSKFCKGPREISTIISTCLTLIQSITSLHGCISYITNGKGGWWRTNNRKMIVSLETTNIQREPIYQNLSTGSNANTLQEIISPESSVNLKVKHELRFTMINVSTEQHYMEDTLQMELKVTDEVIENATNKIIEICSDSKTSTNGIKLEKHEAILDSCSSLMKAIKILIKKSRLLQEEIVAQGKAHFPGKEFYKRNSQWAEGLISASKDIAKGANFLVESANRLLTAESSNNFEIIVAAQEIAASTAQLVIASNVKADRYSRALAELTKASRKVSQATESVVAAVKDGNIQENNLNELELIHLTPSQLKTKEMEIHVKVLELEQALQNERYKLMAFRKACYRNCHED